MTTVFSIIFLTLYIADVVILLLYTMNLFYMFYLSKKHFQKTTCSKLPAPETFPVVTVKLPLYNEKYVAERIIKGAVAIDYPKDKLQILVLDDSTDETLEISGKCVNFYRSQGFNISLIHRKIRTGQKGGALREALEKTEGEFIAIFDSDFIPAKNIFKDTIPHFLNDPRLGMVQTRWGHINPGISLLTRAQAIAIDTHFAVDQVARFGKNLFFNFNGTAGVWRKHCIIDAGNWQDDTLTEDLDLSYRARLRGWKFLYNKDIVNPAELPIWVNSYKSQQFRWAKGSIQTAMKLAGSILKSKIPLFVKFQAFMHLTYYSVHLFLIVNILFLLPILGMDNLLWNSNFLLLYGFLFTPVLIVAAPAVCLYSQYKFYPDWKTKMLWIPSIMLAGTGIAVNNSKAFLEAIFKKQSQFIRTPKTGIQNKKENWKNKKYLPPWSFLSLLEFGLILYIVLAITYAFRLKNMYLIPILFFYLSAFGYIFFLEIIQHIQMRSRL